VSESSLHPQARSVKTSMTRVRRNLIAAIGVAALAIPSAAIANHGENHGHGHANGHSKTHNVAYVFKGTYEGESMVKVAHGNARVRKGGFLEQTVTFDLSGARITVADTNADQTTDLNDVQVGDTVLVKAMLPKSDPGTQPFAAKHLVDQTHPPTE
jgi:cation transport ATPase